MLKTRHDHLSKDLIVTDTDLYMQLWDIDCNNLDEQSTKLINSSKIFCKPKGEYIEKCSDDYDYILTCGSKVYGNNCSKYKVYGDDDYCGVPTDKPRIGHLHGYGNKCVEYHKTDSGEKMAMCANITIDKGSLKINTFYGEVTCKNSDVSVQMPLYKFKVICPDIQNFIDVNKRDCKDFCNMKGFCKNNKCECFDGYEGTYCEKTSSVKSVYAPKFVVDGGENFAKSSGNPISSIN